jgi:DNA-binding MarR family transcriptional regulator
MSWKASAYVKTLTRAPDGSLLTHTEKLLLMVLSDYYNDAEGAAWPSIERLARETLISRRQVIRITGSLVQRGMLARAPRQRGVRTTQRYCFPTLPEE